MKFRPAFHSAEEYFRPTTEGAERSVLHPYRDEEVAETLRLEASSDLGVLSLHSYNTLLAAQEEVEATPQVLLADSLDKLEHESLSAQDKRIVRGIAEYDARQLAAAVTEEPTDKTLYSPPSLKDLLLIARAYDDLGDPELLYVLQSIIEKGGINTEFEEAVERSVLSGGPISGEYQNIIAENGARIDSQADDTQQQVVSWMREASKRPVPHLERLVARHKKDDTDENGTGFIM